MRFADIYILLGMGEAHGDAAYRWTFEDINDQFSVKEEGKVEQVASFEDGKKTIFFQITLEKEPLFVPTLQINMSFHALSILIPHQRDCALIPP